MFNVNVKNGAARQYPQWNMRGKIKKVDEEGNIVQGKHSFGREVVRISPRFQKAGANFRVRPERANVFFAAYAFENGLLDTQLTPEECGQPEIMEILEGLFQEHKFQFPKLESPFAASDDYTEPSLKVGFSFCILQVLVEPMGVARTNHAGPTIRPMGAGAGTTSNLEAARQKIAEMRARAAAGSQNGTKRKKSPGHEGEQSPELQPST